MIEAVKQAVVVVRSNGDAEAVRQQLGSPVEAGGRSLAFTPSSRAFSRGSVQPATVGETDFVVVSLELAPGLSLGSLTGAFGPSRPGPPTPLEEPEKMSFLIDGFGLPYRATLIAQVESGPITEARPVRKLVLQRLPGAHVAAAG